MAIGKFDGIHLGHRRLLKEIIEQKKNGLAACVFTFDPAPAVLFGYSDKKELTTRYEKRRLFEQMGFDILIEFPLTKLTAAIPPGDFVTEILVKQMNAGFVAAGKDLSFGDRGMGNATLLTEMSKDYGFTVKIIDKVCVDDTEVSSTYIRALVENGDMERAEKFLGMPYSCVGRVEHGNRIGRTLGFPTINLIPDECKLMPPCGVYYSEVFHKGKMYKGISNVGYKPTVSSIPLMGLETYIYNFSDEIYDETVEVFLHRFKRPEQHFDGLEELKKQLDEDIEEGAVHFNLVKKV